MVMVSGVFRGWAATELYVATNGNDRWTGRLPTPNSGLTDGPFATLDKGRDELRRLKRSGPLTGGATVYVRGGTYYLTNLFYLCSLDSGLINAPVVYRSYPGEEVVLVGGLPIRNFVPYQGQIFKADVGTQGFRGIYFRQLFFNRTRQHLARYPNFSAADPYGSGWSYVDGELISMDQDSPNDSRRRFRYKDAHPGTWARPAEAEVCIFPRYNWGNDLIGIASIDPSQRLITLNRDASQVIRPGDRYFVRNVFEELDAPGEWYLDNTTWTLYFWPPGNVQAGSVYAPTRRDLVYLESASDVILQGLTLEGTEGTPVSFSYCTRCVLQGCIIRNVGDFEGCGVKVSAGSNNGIIGNDLYEIGGTAIVLTGGTRSTLAPAGNYAENNEVHAFGVFNKKSAGIHVTGVGNRVRRNTVHDGPRFGIWCSGNNQVVELNRVHHVNLETDDTGIIYCNGLDWLSPRGSIIRNNFLSDSPGFGFLSGQRVQPWHAVGIYLDDDAAGVDVVGNIVANCSQAALKLHNARDNFIANNIFLNCDQQLVGYWGWTSSSGNWGSLLPGMTAAYESVAGQPAWQNLRGMNVHPADAVLPGGLIMANNQFVRNILVYTNVPANLAYFRNVAFANNRWDSNVVFHPGQSVTIAIDSPTAKSWSSWRAQGQDLNSVVADPLFVNAPAGDFRLRPESPALRLGFEQIPIDQIGIYPSPVRVTAARPGSPIGLSLIPRR